MAIYGTRNLEWKGDTLRLCGKGSPVVTIVPDGTLVGHVARAPPRGALDRHGQPDAGQGRSHLDRARHSQRQASGSGMTSMPPPLVTIIDAGRVVGFALSRGDAEERSLGTHPTIE